MTQIIEVSDEILKTYNSEDYTLRKDLEMKSMQIADLDRSGWIVIPEEFTNGKYKALVNPARLSCFSPAVEKVAGKLDLTLKNTLKDTLGRPFIGRINWGDSLRINSALGNKTPNLNEEADFLKLLYQGMQGKIKVYNKSGKQLDEKSLENVFYDVVGAKSPYRGEWLDAFFKVQDNKIYINYNHVFNLEEGLVPKHSELLDKNTLMKGNRYKISLEDWLENHTRQGLPNKEIKSGGDLSYSITGCWDLSAAVLCVGSGGCSLSGGSDPSSEDSYKGVRSLFKKE